MEHRRNNHLKDISSPHKEGDDMGDISKKQRLSAEGKKETPPKVTHEKRMTDQSMMPYEKNGSGY